MNNIINGINTEALPVFHRQALTMLSIALAEFDDDERMTALLAMLAAEINRYADNEREFEAMLDAVPAVIKQWATA
jgi:vacuolar-type H+-ATPase catalytic subunit A/Vma1